MYDPEIPVDIVNLGLIYDVAVIELENGLHHVAVKMTLTAPGCGMGPHLVMEAKDRIEALEGVEAADVECVGIPLEPGHGQRGGQNETRIDLISHAGDVEIVRRGSA